MPGEKSGGHAATTQGAEDRDDPAAEFQQMREEIGALPEYRVPEGEGRGVERGATTQPSERMREVLSGLFRLRLDPPVVVLHGPPVSLQVETTLPDTGGEARLPLGSSTVLARILVDRSPSGVQPQGGAGGRTHDARGGLPTVPNSFKLALTEFDAKALSMSQTEVFFQFDLATLQVVRDTETPTRATSVQLIQVTRVVAESDPAEDPLRLLIREVDKATGETKVDLKLSAPDFASLRRKYPAEVTSYLRPVLADLGQLSPLFSADSRNAWQVLAPRLTPEAGVVEKVKGLLPKLDADEFGVRQAAQRELSELGQAGALACRRLDRAGLTPQQNSEVDSFLASVSTLTAKDARQLAGSVDFLLDCLELEEAELRTAAWAGLREVARPVGVFEPGASAEVRGREVGVLRKELLPRVEGK
jgi:hypothetical protein